LYTRIAIYKDCNLESIPIDYSDQMGKGKLRGRGVEQILIDLKCRGRKGQWATLHRRPGKENDVKVGKSERNK
jgi:hypothetical protein